MGDIVTVPDGELRPPGRTGDPLACPLLADAGVYLLGALVPRERAGYAGHLDACAACRREVDELAHLPALLNRVTAWFVLPGEGDPASPAGPGGL